MSERIDNLNTADLAVVNYFDRISRKLDVTLEVDGSSIVIDGDDGLKRLRARECIEALVMFAQKEDGCSCRRQAHRDAFRGDTEAC